MKRFFYLNGNKLLGTLGFILLIAFIFALLDVLYSYNYGQTIDVYFMSQALGVLVLATFIVYALLSYRNWNKAQEKINSLLSENPFNQLHQIGFLQTVSFIDNRTKFSKDSMSIIVSDYTIEVDHSPKTNCLRFLVKCSNTTKRTVRQANRSLLSNQVFNMGHYFYMDLNNALTIDQLEQEVHEFIALLKYHRFEPA